jgi:hypothetical protein
LAGLPKASTPNLSAICSSAKLGTINPRLWDDSVFLLGKEAGAPVL